MDMFFAPQKVFFIDKTKELFCPFFYWCECVEVLMLAVCQKADGFRCYLTPHLTTFVALIEHMEKSG